MAQLTQLAHQHVARYVNPGDSVIDATAGNGHDTIFLAHLVGPRGRVFAFDIQDAAIMTTRQKLEDMKLQQVTLIPESHGHLKEQVPADSQGQIAAVMFNLGYLPGAEHHVTTHCESTLEAIDAAIEVLRPGGVISLICYVGHPGGLRETEAVEGKLEDLSRSGWRLTSESVEGKPSAPRLHIVESPTNAR